MKNWFLLLLSRGALLFLGVSLAARAEDVKMDWLSSGAARKSGYFRPLHLVLSPVKPDGIKTLPPDLTAPLYGKLELGPAEAPTTFYVIVDEPEGKPSRLFVDANANGDFTDDPAPEWKGDPDKGPDGIDLTQHSGGADLQVPYGAEKLKAHLVIIRFDKHDARRVSLTNFLFYFRDYARAGDVSLGGKTYHAMLLDENATGDFRPPKGESDGLVTLLLDLNNNGIFEHHGESFDAAKPFNIGGTTYEIADLTASGGSFQFVKSSQTVEETKPRPNLIPGATALPFETKTADGDTIHFPDKYKGKLVLMDFWATWCLPCRREMPHLVSAYQKYHDKGIEMLGINLDQPHSADKLAQFTRENKMPWPEVYEGKPIAQQYYIETIPDSFLVDGDTGKILAEGEVLQGDALLDTIQKALAKRQP
jgi:thiol-disulfide isomerase/thioredoxin